MSDLYGLSAAQMATLSPCFTKSHSKPRVEDKHVLNGIIIIHRNGSRWGGAPVA